MAEETAVLDAAVDGGAVENQSSESNSTPVEPVGSNSDQAADPNDLFSQLNAAMDGVLPKDEAAAAQNQPADGQPAAIPQEFQAALEISPYVTSPEGVQQAIRAADEVWQVAAGQIPARNLLEGMRSVNPQGFETIVADLKDYLGVQAQPAQAQPSPIDALKASNPQAYQQLATWWQQVTGKAIDAGADPRDQRLAALEQRYAQEEEQRNIAAHNAQVERALGSASEWVNKTIAGTFAEGLADRFLAPNTGLLWQKAQQMQIPAERLQGELLQGKTETLAKIWKAVAADEAAVIRKYNANLVKQHNTLKNAVPANKTSKVAPGKQVQGAPLRKEGESEMDYAKRVWDSGFTA